MYWLEVYTLIAVVIFSAAGLLILALYVCYGLSALFFAAPRPARRSRGRVIGTSVALPNPLANLEVSENDEIN